jgi:transposase-like protein
LQHLRKAIGEPPILIISSDAYKELTMTVGEVFPSAERRECFRHLMQNYMKQFAGKDYVYTVAWAYRSEVYEHHMVNVASIGGVTTWLKEYHSLLWYRSSFNPVIKCDYIANNIVEVFNNWIKRLQ